LSIASRCTLKYRVVARTHDVLSFVELPQMKEAF
jgi:hypothetical protein